MTIQPHEREREQLPALVARCGRVVALGDSLTSGEGVGIVTPPEATWAALLAESLGATDFRNLARAGARLAQVANVQLPQAISLRPEVATVCVGLNDIVKTGCPPEHILVTIGNIVGGLRAVGSQVVLAQLHDPSKIFRLPKGLAAQVSARSMLVNEACARAADGDPGVVLIDMGALQAERAYWAIDRVHPSVWGQLQLARLAAAALAVPDPMMLLDAPRPYRRRDEMRWMVTCGMPWLAKRFGEVGPPVAGMAVAAARRRLLR